MSNKLQTKLDAILEDKNTNLLPEHLKAGVTCLGVEGKFEGGVGQVKLFETEEQMQADANAEEGDLAVVYRSEVQNATVDSKFQIATFPETVVLSEAMTDYTELTYRATDSSIMFDGRGHLDNSGFTMDCWVESDDEYKNIRIEYTSEDGITYIRTDTLGNPVDFTTEIYYTDRPEYWNDRIGKFIQVGGSTFDGLYQYKENYIDLDKFQCINYSSVSVSDDGTTAEWDGTLNENIYSISKLVSLLNSTGLTTDYTYPIIFMKTNNEICAAFTKRSDYAANNMLSVIDSNGNLIGFGNNTSTVITAPLYKLDFANNTATFIENIVSIESAKGYQYLSISNMLTIPMRFVISEDENKFYFDTFSYYINNESSSNFSLALDYSIGIKTSGYLIAPTQLSITPDYVYEKEFYGKNGIENGTLTQSISNSFTDTNAAVYSKIQNTYNDMEPRVLTDDDKTIDKNIHCIPSNKGGVPLLDTSSVTAMNEMFDGCTNLTFISQLDTSSVTSMVWTFRNCTNLTTIPLLDTSKVTNMDSMFSGCTSLTEIPQLDTSSVTIMANIFYNCINLTTIPLLDTSSVTDAHWMFNGCTNLTSIPELDTSKVDNMKYMFSGCANLTTIPLLNTSKVDNMKYMFSGCTNLTDESLNNILLMCANATSYTNTKTLKDIGLTSEQATRCQSLSNYSAFTSAGWTTGY